MVCVYTENADMCHCGYTQSVPGGPGTSSVCACYTIALACNSHCIYEWLCYDKDYNGSIAVKNTVSQNGTAEW